jgi:hypothetical protein
MRHCLNKYNVMILAISELKYDIKPLFPVTHDLPKVQIIFGLEKKNVSHIRFPFS